MMPPMPVEAVPWLMEKAPTSLVGSAGEHYVMTHLLLRGCMAALTPRGAPDADILVHSAGGAVMADVQVKARSGRSGRGWRMSERNERARDGLFYCFVDFGHKSDWPVYVMPAAVVSGYLTQSHAEWLGTPGRHGQQRTDWSGRFISPRPLKTIFAEGWMNDYLNRWDYIMTGRQSI
jgi:hypothetical protein